MRDLWEMFSVFFKIGILTFGGGYTMLPLLQKDVVQKRSWATDEELLDFYAISQSLPGIIAGNTAMLIGYKKKKIPGLSAALLGVSTPSIIIILIVAMFIRNFLEIAAVQHAFNGIRVAVVVLIVNTTASMWKSCIKDRACIAIFGAAQLIFTFINVSPVIPVIAGAVAGITLKGRKAAS